MTGPADFVERAVLHALGALPVDEREAFEVERLARGAEGERIVAAARRGAARAGAAPRAMTGPAEREALAGVVATPSAPRPWRAAGWVAGVVLALLAVGAALWALSVQRHNDNLQAALAAAAAHGDSLRAAIAARDAVERARPSLEILTALLAAPDVTPIALPGSGPGHGRLYLGPAHALLVAEDLPPLPERDDYRLWRLGPGGPEPVAALGRAPEGRLLALLPIGVLDGAGGVRVTAEAAGGNGTGPAGATILERLGPLR